MNDRFKFRFFNEYSNKLESCDEYDLKDIFESGNPVMQCTGLKDKNKKLIYEGDIVRYSEYDNDVDCRAEWEYAEVVWGGNYDYPAFDLKDTDFDGTNGLSYIFGEGWTIEVCGNIYENPDILEGKR